jgi:hypothetical protein
MLVNSANVFYDKSLGFFNFLLNDKFGSGNIEIVEQVPFLNFSDPIDFLILLCFNVGVVD